MKKIIQHSLTTILISIALNVFSQQHTTLSTNSNFNYSSEITNRLHGAPLRAPYFLSPKTKTALTEVNEFKEGKAPSDLLSKLIREYTVGGIYTPNATKSILTALINNKKNPIVQKNIHAVIFKLLNEGRISDFYAYIKENRKNRDDKADYLLSLLNELPNEQRIKELQKEYRIEPSVSNASYNIAQHLPNPSLNPLKDKDLKTLLKSVGKIPQFRKGFQSANGNFSDKKKLQRIQKFLDKA